MPVDPLLPQAAEDEKVSELLNNRLMRVDGLNGAPRDELCLLLGMCAGTIVRLRHRLQEQEQTIARLQVQQFPDTARHY
jgi:hypothetical protein